VQALSRAALVGHAAAPQHLGEAPVHDLHLAERADHDVRGLEVAVQHALAVRIGDRLAHRLEYREHAPAVLIRRAALLQERRQRLPLDQLHREVRPLVGHQAELVHGHDAGVLQLAADLRLLDEALHDLGALGQLAVEHLHRHVAAEVRVVALEDHAHAAARDLAQQLVVAAPLRHELRRRRAGIDDRRGAVLRARVGQQDLGREPRPLAEDGEHGAVGRGIVRRVRLQGAPRGNGVSGVAGAV
jgi:hypothetical protein